VKITIGPADVGGCGHYRLLSPFTKLAEAKGHELHVAEQLGDQRLWTSDVTIFQRVSTERVLNFIQAMRGCPGHKPGIVMEIDDNLRTVPPANPCSAIYGNGRPATKIFEAAAKLCDALIVSTAELAREYENLNAERYVCPNAIADEDFNRYELAIPISNRPKRLGQLRIGYAGTNSHNGDVATIVKPLSDFMRHDHRATFVTFGGDLRPLFPRELHGRIEHHASIDAKPFQMAHPGVYRDAIIPAYYSVLSDLDLDIAVAPIERHVFNKGKSNLKILEYGMMGIPVIATRYGEYAAYAEAAPQAILTAPADDERAWRNAIELLANNGDKRAFIAEANRDFIRSSYVLSATMDRWTHALDSIVKETAAAA
jgi:glycosyltransferase involved in cell wall biosynthesis